MKHGGTTTCFNHTRNYAVISVVLHDACGCCCCSLIYNKACHRIVQSWPVYGKKKRLTAIAAEG